MLRKYLFSLVLIGVSIFMIPLNICLAQKTAISVVSNNYVNIPQNTMIQLFNIDDLHSNINQKHDLIRFRLLTDLKINNEVILPKDTTIEGSITKIHGSRLLGESGLIRIKLKDITVNNNAIIHFPNELKLKGSKNYTSVASSIVIPFSGLLLKGYEVNCPAGSTIKYIFDYED